MKLLNVYTKFVFFLVIVLSTDPVLNTNPVTTIADGYTQECRTLLQKFPCNKVIVWGHKLHSHTHSYIHEAFVKTFNYLGIPTFWLDNHDDVTTFDFSKSLFITEGLVDQQIPLRDDCFYIIHHCDYEKYRHLYDINHCIALEVYTNDCLNHGVTMMEPYVYYSLERKILYMPWATDLLPHEIDEIKKNLPNIAKDNAIYFIGSIWGEEFGNMSQIAEFRRACSAKKISLISRMQVSDVEHRALIGRSCIAPAIQGAWQCKVGYIPCRIFKNISYGQMGITNNETVYNLFNKKIIYNQNIAQLLSDGLARSKTQNIEELYELMDFVKNNHTYLNRIASLLKLFYMIDNKS